MGHISQKEEDVSRATEVEQGKKGKEKEGEPSQQGDQQEAQELRGAGVGN